MQQAANRTRSTVEGGVKVQRWHRHTSTNSGWGCSKGWTFNDLQEAKKFVRKQPLKSDGEFPDVYCYVIEDHNGKKHNVLTSAEQRTFNRLSKLLSFTDASR